MKRSLVFAFHKKGCAFNTERGQLHVSIERARRSTAFVIGSVIRTAGRLPRDSE